VFALKKHLKISHFSALCLALKAGKQGAERGKSTHSESKGGKCESKLRGYKTKRNGVTDFTVITALLIT
jgi:hypothetical protein